jgi:predicted RNase H-like HicB family nuclease
MRHYHFSIRIEKHAEGYAAFCSELQGCYAQGKTYEAALAAIRDAVRLHVEDRLAEGEEIPQAESVSLTSLDIAV